MQAIVVLNDGETWTDAHNCSILVVTEAQMDALYTGVKPKDLGLTPVVALQFEQVEGRLHNLKIGGV